MEHIGLAAHLAIFDIALPHSSGRIYAGFIPLTAACALKARLHDRSMIVSAKKWPALFCRPLY
jgi:hypothetical protein